MKESCQNFASTLAQQSRGLSAAEKDVVDDWAPDDPPDTILFAALGRQVVEDINKTKDAINRKIFDLIENAMEGDDDELRTAVATGLIEAMVTRTDGDEPLWLHVLSMLGNASKKHAIAWRSWGS